MPFAHENLISRDPIEGGIEITEQQYLDALVGMQSGLIVSIEGGFVVAAPQAETDPAAIPTLAELKAKLVRNVDNVIAFIYANWMRFEAEYKEREKSAQAFADAAFAVDPDVWVTSFATAAGLPNQQAALLILSQAEALRSALAALGALRMQKYGIAAASSAQLAQGKHDEIVAAAEAIAAGLQ